MRRAFTLAELLLVLAVIGILLGFAIPRVSRVIDRLQVNTAASYITSAHQRARLMALTGARPVVFLVSATELSIRRRGETEVLWTHPGPSDQGVSFEGSAREFTFSPDGLTMGLSNATLHLSRGAASTTVIVSRLGRIRIAR